MKFPILIMLLLLLVSSNLNCQNVNTSRYFEPPLVGRYYIWSYPGIGSPLLQDWQYGRIFLNTGDTVLNKLLNMDCSKNTLLWMPEGKSIVAIDKNSIKGFDIQNPVGRRNFMKVGLKSLLGSDTAQLYLEVLHAGTISLYVYRKVGIYNKVSSEDGRSVVLNKYIHEPVYYIRIKAQLLKAVRLNKRSIINAFEDDGPVIKEILINSRIRKIKSENQLLDAILAFDRNL